MEFILSFLFYLVGAALIGLAAAWATRQVASGAGIAWRGDGWPRGVQEEEPRPDWGGRFRTPSALAQRSAEVNAQPTIEELNDRQVPNVPLQPVRR